jgi:hypothetical protein
MFLLFSPFPSDLVGFVHQFFALALGVNLSQQWRGNSASAP